MRNGVGEPVPIRYIIFPSYGLRATPRLRSLDPSEGARKLLENSANFNKFGGNGLHIIARLLEEAECFDLTCGQLERTADLIDNTVRGLG